MTSVLLSVFAAARKQLHMEAAGLPKHPSVDHGEDLLQDVLHARIDAFDAARARDFAEPDGGSVLVGLEGSQTLLVRLQKGVKFRTCYSQPGARERECGCI